MLTPAPRILFVDDEPAILSAVKRLLRRDHYEVETALDGERGLEVFRRFRPSVVVSDHRMPGMSGVEFLVAARKIDPEPVRVILTGCTDLPSAEAAINEGEVWRFLTKPWNDEDLRATIAGAAERFRLVAENRLMADKLSSIGLLAGGVAHELNNPIGGILAFSQMMQKDFPAGSQTGADLKQIEDAAHRAKRIVADLLDFARTSRGATQRVMRLHESAEKAITLARFQIRGPGIEIEVAADPSAPSVFADPNRIEQVALNLLANAIQAVGASGRGRGQIRVRTFTEGDAVCLSVSDDGPGIPAEARDRIFDAFYTTKSAGEGTGLGLTISLGIVRDAGGTIELASQPGQGATFTIKLPALQTERVAMAGGAA